MAKVFEKQKYFKFLTRDKDGDFGTIKLPKYNECKCGKFTGTNTKRLTHWSLHCLSCGSKFRC